MQEKQMEVKITTFKSPFSFFCLPADASNAKDICISGSNSEFLSNKIDFSGVSHGQYVAVFWNDHWARGIVSKETLCQIWLVDYGLYVRLNDNTVFVNLPPEDKRCPTKVFEASLHGVTPVDKVLADIFTGDVELKVGMTWCQGAVEKAQNLIHSAAKVHFVPVALLDTKINEVVIGDLYLQINNQGIVSLIDALEDWPVFLRKDPECYIEYLPKYYKNRRQHRASLKRPAIAAELPVVTLHVTISEYSDICAKAAKLEISECNDSAEEGSTLTYLYTKPLSRDAFNLTPEEIDKYSGMYIEISGREYNLLNVLCNKARDLYMCERYADLKSVGRATSRHSFRNNDFD